MVPFTRNLGPRSGVQLNPILDNSERFVAGNADQSFGVVGKFERGRFDKPFRVNRSNLYRLLGTPSSTQVSRLNETFIHIFEAFQAGASEAIVHRLTPAADRSLLLAVAKSDPVAANVWTTSATVPVSAHLFTLKVLEAANEGNLFEINAIAKQSESLAATALVNVPLTGSTPLTVSGTTLVNGDRVKLTAQTTGAQNGTYTVSITGGTYTLTAAATLVNVATKDVKVRIKDTLGSIWYEFKASLDPAAKDEFGQSTYLPNVVSSLTDAVEVTVFSGASVATTAPFYGTDANGADIYTSTKLVYFTEGGTGYLSADYEAATTALKYSDFNFGYLAGGGTRAVALISKLVSLAKDINKQFVWDVPGDLTPAAAITFYNQLSIDTHYSQAYWTPIKADDPVNGGKDYIGSSGFNIGLRCARNAVTDANGLPPKNFAVAGKNYPLTRTGILQTYTPNEKELDDLATARINPVIFQRYNGGSKYVFVDSLTGAKSEADRKLINVAEMSSQNDDYVTGYANELLQLPMKAAIKAMTDFLQNLFEAEQAANWIKPTTELDGAAFAFEVKENANRPADRMDVNYILKYDGTTRAIYVQQTISK